MNRTTDTLFLRVDPALARTVRYLAQKEKVSISAWAELALTARVNDSTAGAHRSKLLQATEEALLSRIEARLANLLRNVQGLYAKEALDVAMILELLKGLIAMGLKDKRQVQESLQGARQEAHRRISKRSEFSFPVPPELEAKLNTLEQEKQQMIAYIDKQEAEIEHLKGKVEALVQAQSELREELGRARRRAENAETLTRRRTVAMSKRSQPTKSGGSRQP